MISLQSAFTLAQVGASLVNAAGERSLDRTRVRAENEVREATIKVRAARNVAAAAKSDTARLNQSINNKRIREAAVATQAAAQGALALQREARSARTFEGRIRAAEDAGALAAKASFLGVTGGSFAAVASTMALQRARQEYATDKAGRLQDYGLEVRARGAASASLTGLDTSTLFATIDHTAPPPEATRRVGGNFLTDLVNAVSSIDPKKAVDTAEDVFSQFRTTPQAAPQRNTEVPLRFTDPANDI